MSSDLANVRAEVKAWERSFKETNGRNPTINDIKQQPTVAQKYKLYKKLSKAATTASSSASEPNGPPSTPPKQTSSTSSLPPKHLPSTSRLIETTTPLASYNPFSPQKKDKGKQRDSILSNLTKSASNPFASPRKSKPQTLERQPPPDPLSLIQPTRPLTSTCLPPEPYSAVSRARKRLRGEPVSPSPNKEKRRRVLSPANLPFPKLQLQAPGNDSDNDEDNGEDDSDSDGGDPLFVDDSPMKPAVNGKVFTFLFGETIKSTSTSELFGTSGPAVQAQVDSKQPKTKLLDVDEDMFSDDSRSKTVEMPSIKAGPSVKSRSSALTKSRPKLSQSTLSFVSNPSKGARKRSPSQTRVPTKRVLWNIEHTQGDMTANDTKVVLPPNEPPASAPQLLPPSPNPNALRLSGKSKPNDERRNRPSKSKNSNKTKPQDDDHDMAEDMENNGSSSDGLNTHHSVKLVHYSRGIRAALATEESNSEIEDPILNCVKHVKPRGQGSRSPVKQGDNDGTDAILDGDEDTDTDVNVDDEKQELPTKLHRVLVLESLKTKQNEYEEERIVRGLLSGRRVLHYDPKKGGEIWGAGEDERDELADEERRIDEEVDEWEGVPVPWEVGELSEHRYHLEEL